MIKWLKYIAGALVMLIAYAVYWGWASDIPHETLAAKYATGTSKFADLPSGARAHYRMQGNKDGKTIVLLHGSNSSLHTWEPWVALLSDDHFIITVDLPGHGLTGETPADDYTYQGMTFFMKEVTETLELKDFILGGNSMGGGITLSYTLTYPEDVSGLILVDASGTRMTSAASEKVDYPLAFDLAGRWYTDWIFENITPRSLASEGLMQSVSVKSVVTEEAIDRYWELVRRPGNRRATSLRFAWYRSQEGRNLPVENINQPALILWGDEDKLIPVEVGRTMHTRMPNSSLKIFNGVGHLPMEEIPVETATAVTKFLAQLP